MSSTPLNNGVLPTSTPIHPPNDSGYFSGDKLPLDRKFDSFSPIKEISNSEKLNEVVESPCLSHFDHNEVARQLDFSNSYDFSGNSVNEYTHGLEANENAFQSSILSFQIHLSNETFLPRQPINSDRQCYGVDFNQNITHVNETVPPCHGDNIKNQCASFKTAHKPRNKIDFFKEFENRNLYYIASSVLSLLSPEDLCRVSCVSKNWNKTVRCDVKANCRRRAFLEDQYSQKENQCRPSPSLGNCLGENRNLHECEHKTVLYNKCNFAATSKQPLIQNPATKFESFVKEGAQGNCILMKCPKCNYAAKNQIGNAYLCTKCDYAFCQQCLSPYLKSHTCSKSKKVSIVIGSKRSRRNLKRL